MNKIVIRTADLIIYNLMNILCRCLAQKNENENVSYIHFLFPIHSISVILTQPLELSVLYFGILVLYRFDKLMGVIDEVE